MTHVCHACEGMADQVREVRPIRVGARSVRVADEFLRCQDCNEEFYLPGQMDATLRRASDAIRQEENLLLPDEIRRIREALGLSQAEFETLLGVGPKTVVRWEKGTVFQNRATDSLLRLIGEDRENAERLARWHGVRIPAARG